MLQEPGIKEEVWEDDDEDEPTLAYDTDTLSEAEEAPAPVADLSFTDHNLFCEMCGGGDSKAPNMIVICDRCEKGFHQRCHRPHIPNYVVINEEAEWLCKTCSQRFAKNHAAQFKPQPPFTGPRPASASDLPYTVSLPRDTHRAIYSASF